MPETAMIDQLYFNPLVPLWIVAVLAVLGLMVIYLGLKNRAHGQGWRLLILTVFLFFLSGPSLIEREQESLPNRVLVLLDQSTSMTIENRNQLADEALAHIQQNSPENATIIVRRLTDAEQNQGSRLKSALQQFLAEENKDQLAAVFIISDGQIHDASDVDIAQLDQVPLHTFLAGSKEFIDRRLVIEQSPEYALVGRPVDMVIRAEDRDGEQRRVRLTVRQNGEQVYQTTIRTNTSWPIQLRAEKRGPLLVEVEISALEGETILNNNRLQFTVNAVRDRLRVLLVSGEPHQGGRIWRQTLKSDPAVDLIHFTILRLPTSRDNTPVDELALIPFPTEELFERQLDKFDLVIFDRYRIRGVLAMQYLRNLAQYVENGGAMLVATGPEFSERFSLYATALSSVLPAAPTGRVSNEGFVPQITELGKRHPVTAGLSLNPDRDKWGRWFRTNIAVALDGNTLMTDENGQPLLVLSKEGNGRIAQFLSDHIWMWARGVEEGGPYDELVRRTAHWLMKEPDLEEEALTVNVRDNTINIETRSLLSQDGLAVVTGPEGFEQRVQLSSIGQGKSTGSLEVEQPGLYTISERDKSQLVAVGVLNDREFDKPYPTDALLGPLSLSNDGGTFWLEDGFPAIRAISSSADGFGNNWAGIRERSASRTLKIIEMPLIPPLWVALLLIGLSLLTWWRESR